MNKTKVWIVGWAAMAAVLGFGGWWWYRSWHYVGTNDAFVDGYMMAISPDILARIISLEVDEGDCVKQGQLLCSLDATIPDAARKTALAKVESLRASVLVKEILLNRVKDDYERGVQGIQDFVITAQKFDHLQKDFEAAIADLELERKNLALAESQVGEVNTYLEHTKILAPCDGVIVKRWGWTGNVLTQGQAIFSLYDLQNVWVTVNLQEGDIEHVKLGSKATIAIDAYPGVEFEGEVFVIKGAAASQFSLLPQDNATGNFTKVAQRIPMYISIRHPEGRFCYLFPGMSAEVRIRIR